MTFFFSFLQFEREGANFNWYDGLQGECCSDSLTDIDGWLGLDWAGLDARGGEEVGERGSGKAKDFVGRMGGSEPASGMGGRVSASVRVRAAEQVSGQFWFGTSSRVQQGGEEVGGRDPEGGGATIGHACHAGVGGWQRMPKGKL